MSAQTKRDVIAATWEALDCASVGAKELEQIQLELERVFGHAGSDSPASIARVLADEGADLRHPEVLECDTGWRERAVSSPQLEFGSLAATLNTMTKLAELSRELIRNSDEKGISELRAEVVAAKEDCLLRAKSAIIDDQARAEAKEIAGWLGVWLNTPELFADWLELRRLSPQFLKKFGGA